MYTRKTLFKTLGALLAVAVLLALLPGAVLADDPPASVTVCATGCDYTSIQDGIDAVAEGGTVNVAAGTYNEVLTVNKPLSLIGAGAGETIIDGTGFSSNTVLTATGIDSGELNISGFTIQGYPTNPDTSDKATEHLVKISACKEPAKVNFVNNKLIGRDDSATNDFGVIAGYNGTCATVINHNEFENIGGNSVLLELAIGPVEVGHNVMKLPGIGKAPGIMSFSYGTEADPNTVTGKHWYHHNHITSMNANEIRSGILVEPGREGNKTSDYGAYEDVLIEENVIENYNNNGILIRGYGPHSSFTGVIRNNTMTGIDIGKGSGVWLRGPLKDTIVSGNNVTNSGWGVLIYDTTGGLPEPENLVIEKNNLAGNTNGLGDYYTVKQVISPNWWGSITGPAAGYIVGNENYSPWCTNPECTAFGPPSDTVYVDDDWVVKTPGDKFDGHLFGHDAFGAIQDGIDAVAEGGKVHVYPGMYNENITIDRAGITLKSTGTAEETIINADKGYGVWITKDLGIVTIDGFTVKGWKGAGIVQGTANRPGTTPHVLNNIVIGELGDEVVGNCIQVTGDNTIVEGNRVKGAYYIGTGPYGASAISVYLANNALVKNNIVSNADYGISVNGGSAWHPEITGTQVIGNTVSESYVCIEVYSDANNTEIIGNTVFDCVIGIEEDFDAYGFGPSNTQAKRNKIFENEVDLSVFTQGTEIPDGHIFDASPNWFGSISGPAAGKIEGEQVVYTPWCGDAYCSFLVPSDDFVYLEGTITETIKPTKGQTILLADGTKINTGGACFEIEVDHVKIMTESPLGAVCKPGSPGITVADGVVNFIVEGLEIDGGGTAEGHGIHFEGAVTDVIISDTFIHGMKGDGVHFTAQPGGYVELKGNLFMGNTGFGVNNAAGTADIDATFNAWGKYTTPIVGTDVSTFVNFDPWTHVDVFVEYVAGTRYEDEVVLDDETITYAVHANLRQAFGAEFTLTFNPAYLQVESVANGTIFTLAEDMEALVVDNTAGTIRFAAGSFVEQSGEGLVLYTVVFKPAAITPITPPNPLLIPGKQGISLFAMSPGSASSLNIYPAALTGIDDVNVYKLPTLAAAPLTGYDVGNPKEFTLTAANPAAPDGRDYDAAKVCLDVPTGATLEYYVETTDEWVPYDPATCLVIGDLKAGDEVGLELRITFGSAGTAVPVTATLYDGTVELVKETFKFAVTGSHAFTGSVQMQGRTVRAGVLVDLVGPYTYQALSTAPISGNLSFTNVATGDYKLTITHDRYLSLIDYELTISADILDWGRFELKGGDLDNDRVITILDASIIGTHYGAAGDSPGDANFDSKVNIQDLAMVGGNYDLTSATAYPTAPTWP